MLKIIVASGFLLAGSASAQTVTVTYDLLNVWLLPNLSHPGQPAQQMTGSFEWTYTVGDYENGSGQFLDMYIPWYGTSVGSLDINVETSSIEFVLPGSYHDLGLDVSIFLLPELTASQRSLVDTTRSSFDIQQGISHKGHMISGRIVPRPTLGTLPPGTSTPPRHYRAGSVGGAGDLPPLTNPGGDARIGDRSFQIAADRLPSDARCYLLISSASDGAPLAGTHLWIDPHGAALIPLRTSGDGSMRVRLPIPNDPLLVGSEIHFQVVLLDRAGPLGFAAATHRLSVTIQAPTLPGERTAR